MKYKIRVIPRSSLNKIVETAPNELKIKITSAPVHGEANKKLLSLLAEHFGVPKSKIKIASGLASKNKIVEII